MKPMIFLDIDGVINPSRKNNSYCHRLQFTRCPGLKIEPPKKLPH